MTARAVAYVPLDGIVYADVNPKSHHEEAIRDSYDRFGVASVPTVDDRTGKLVAGHGRIDALRALHAAGAEPPDGVQVNDEGEWFAPVLTGWASKDDNEAAAYLVADNQTTVTKPGDVWIMGDHRLLCGDARNADHVARLIDQPINLAFTSPPYADRRKYDESTEFRPIPPDEYVEWFAPVAANVATHLADDGSWFVNAYPGAEEYQRRRYLLDVVLGHIDAGWLWVDEFIWPRAGMPHDPNHTRRFRHGWESVYHFASRHPWKFRPDSVRHQTDHAFKYEGLARRISYDYQGISGPGGNNKARVTGPGLAYPSTVLPNFGSSDAIGHAAAFPVGLPAWFIRAYTDPDDTVLDPFMGSGSTLIAAEKEGRRGYGIEISPAYCDVVVKRWQDFTGNKAHHADTGEPFPS